MMVADMKNCAPPAARTPLASDWPNSPVGQSLMSTGVIKAIAVK